MTSLALIPNGREIVDDALNRAGIEVPDDVRRRIVGDLAGRVLFDADRSRVLLADPTGAHPMAELASDGSVVDVDLIAHVRKLAGNTTLSAPAGDPANPWSKAGWSRTRQAILTNTKPGEAKRLKDAVGQQ